MREDFDEIAKEYQKILNTEYTQKLDELYGMGGTSGGARPKIMTRIHDEEKVHMLTAAALLELDFEQPSLDYHELMKLTKILTMNHAGDVENMYRRMCFNVFAHNRDDHSKNFTYIYNEATDRWRLAPAYDLTYSNTYYGEHTTSVDGNGKNPGRKELIAVGVTAGMPEVMCRKIADDIRECVDEMLGEYLRS